jgi:hypothetical protein
MGWGSEARRAAAQEAGRQNWRRYAARRQAAGVFAAIAVVAVAVVLGVRALARVWPPGWTSAITSWLMLVAIGLALLVVLRFGWSRRRPYRMPRRRFRTRY